MVDNSRDIPIVWIWKSRRTLMVLDAPAAPYKVAPQLLPWGLGLQGSDWGAGVGAVWAMAARKARIMDVLMVFILLERAIA